MNIKFFLPVGIVVDHKMWINTIITHYSYPIRVKKVIFSTRFDTLYTFNGWTNKKKTATEQVEWFFHISNWWACDTPTTQNEHVERSSSHVLHWHWQIEMRYNYAKLKSTISKFGNAFFLLLGSSSSLSSFYYFIVTERFHCCGAYYRRECINCATYIYKYFHGIIYGRNVFVCCL